MSRRRKITKRELEYQERIWKRVYTLDNWRENNACCVYCGVKIKIKQLTADHVVPRSKGGITEKKNIKAACYECNVVKSSMSVADFMNKITNPSPKDSIDIHLIHFRWKLEQRLKKLDQLFR